MGVEIEVKLRVDDPRQMREKLQAAGARRLGTVLEHNTYFDTPEETLRKADSGLRIRVMEAADGSRRAVLTYKGPRREGELKIRQEEQTQIASARAATAILAGLGYRPMLAFQKRRESFELDAARVELDELPEMGFYLEIEADDEAAVRRVRGMLGLDNQAAIPSPYVALVARHLAADHGAKSRELTFG